MKAQQRVTLGYESTFNITDKLILNSNLEFSAIWRDTSINAANVEITSNNLISLAKNVQINSPAFSAVSPECKISETSTQSLTGNCQDTSRPKVRLKAFETNILKDTTLTFDTSRSLAPNGIKEMILKVNSEVLSGNSYTFTSSGVYYVEAILIDNQDFKSSIKRKVVVKEVYKKDLRAYFRYEVRDEVLSLIYIQNIAKDQISTAKFKVYDQYGATLLEERVLSNVYHLDTAEIEGLSKGTYKVGLEILKTDGELVVYEQDIFVGSNLEVSNALPLLDFDLYQSAPKEVFLDARRILDPYHNFKEIIVDWGDEESESFEPDFLIGEKHLYPSIATYEVKVTGIKENENGEEIIHEIIKEISVTNESVPSLAPIASFYYDINDQIPYVIFNINLVRSPTSTIENIKFDFGDGQIFEGSAENFPEIHTHFYDPGVYIATLTATDIQGLSTSLSSRIIVTESGPPLVTDLNCDVIEGKTITCETTLVDKYKEITNATINWGDGSTSQLVVINGEWLWDNFDHTYDQFGKYNIEVTVNTIRGQSVTRTLEYELKDEVTPAPSLFLNCETNYLNLNCNAFTDFENASKLSRIDFYLDDVLVQSGASTSYNYTASENKSVKIYAVGSFGEEGISTSDAHNISLRANEAPVADFLCSSNTVDTISCVNLSSDDSATISYAWYIGEGLISNDFELSDFLIENNNSEEISITLVAIDSEGVSSRATKIVYVFTAPAPIAKIECVRDLLSISCTSNGSYDPLDATLNYVWKLNGVESGVDSLFTYTAQDNQQVEVELTVSNGRKSASVRVVEYLVSNEEGYLNASLNCINVGDVSLRCNISDDEYLKLKSLKWFVNDVLVSENTNKFEHAINEVGDIEVSIIIENDLFSREITKVYNIVYSPPIADFSFFISEDGKVEMDARDSIKNSRIVVNYSWLVEGEEAILNTITPAMKFEYDKVVGKSLSLTVTDQKGATSSLSKLIDLSGENRPINLEVDILRPRGNASREVIFDATKSLDFDGEVEEIVLIIEEERIPFEEMILNYEFSSRGDKNFSIEATDNLGRKVTKEYNIFIEELRVYESDSIFYQLSFNNLTFSNYKASNGMKVFVNNIEISSDLNREDLVVWVTPYIEAGDYNLRLEVDDLIWNKTITINEEKMPSNPSEEILSIIDSYSNEIINRKDELGLSDDKIVELEQIKSEVNQYIGSIYNEDVLKLTAIFLRQQKRELKEDEVLTSSIKFNPLLELLLPSAYADVYESQVYSEKQSCEKSLFWNDTLSTIYTHVASAARMSSSQALTLSIIALPITGGSSAAVTSTAIAVAVSVSITDLIANILFYAHKKDTIKNCLDKVKFPDIRQVVSSNFEFEESGVVVDGEIKIVASRPYKTTLKVPALTYKSFRDDIYQSPVLNLIKGKIQDFDVDSGVLIEAAKKVFDDASRTGFNFATSTLEVTSKSGQLLARADFHTNVITHIGSLQDDVMVMDVGNMVSLDDKRIKFYGSHIVAKGSNLREENFSTIIVPTDNDFLTIKDKDSINKKIGFKIIDGCDGEILYPYISLYPDGNNLYHDGYISLSAKIDGNVTMSQSSIVCKGAQISANGTLDLDNSRIAGESVKINVGKEGLLRISNVDVSSKDITTPLEQETLISVTGIRGYAGNIHTISSRGSSNISIVNSKIIDSSIDVYSDRLQSINLIDSTLSNFNLESTQSGKMTISNSTLNEGQLSLYDKASNYNVSIWGSLLNKVNLIRIHKNKILDFSVTNSQIVNSYDLDDDTYFKFMLDIDEKFNISNSTVTGEYRVFHENYFMTGNFLISNSQISPSSLNSRGGVIEIDGNNSLNNFALRGAFKVDSTTSLAGDPFSINFYNIIISKIKSQIDLTDFVVSESHLELYTKDVKGPKITNSYLVVSDESSIAENNSFDGVNQSARPVTIDKGNTIIGYTATGDRDSGKIVIGSDNIIEYLYLDQEGNITIGDSNNLTMLSVNDCTIGQELYVFDVVCHNSSLLDGAFISKSDIINKSSVDMDANIDDSVIDNAHIGEGVSITRSIIRNTTMNENKTDKTCDGIDDFLETDACLFVGE